MYYIMRTSRDGEPYLDGPYESLEELRIRSDHPPSPSLSQSTSTGRPPLAG